MSTSSTISSFSYSNPAIHHQPLRYPSQQQPTQVAGTAKDIEDIVHLSRFAQLVRQGQSASVIAGASGLSVSVVDRELGIPTTSPSVTVVAAQGPGVTNAAAPATRSSKATSPAHTLSVFA